MTTDSSNSASSTNSVDATSYPNDATNSQRPAPRNDRPAIVVGGGLAGLSAAAALSDRGIPVLLLESRPRLGGRASSVVDSSTGMLIDTCQHVAMGCCTNFLHLCRLLGVSSMFDRAEKLHFIAPDGTIVPFESSFLPAPLHLTGALLRLPYLSLGEKWQLVRGIRRLARLTRDAADQLSFADWLELERQPRNVIDRFWNVILVSALSETADRIGANYARHVIVEGFMKNREGWKIYLPNRPLTELYAAMVARLSAQGAIVKTQTGVNELEVSNQRVTAVVDRHGKRYECSDCVLTVSFDRVESLLPVQLRSDETLARIGQLQPAPISSVHLWFDREIMSLPRAAFVDRFSQWIFHRKADSVQYDENGTASREEEFQFEGGVYYQVVISASRHVVELDASDVIERVLSDLHAVWPASRAARLLRSRLMTDHRAVFSPRAGVDRLRPVQQTTIENLQLAGDWTKTGWPATMESAVRGGFLAAENILRRRGISASIVQPDLTSSRLGKWLFGM